MFGYLMIIFSSYFLWISCYPGTDPIPPNDQPRVKIVINHDSVATNDTLLRVSIPGENIALMKLGLSDDLSSFQWEPYDSLQQISVPRSEGVIWVWGKFTSTTGVETGMLSDSIYMDFTTEIKELEIIAESNTLHPGDHIIFIISTEESGKAEVNLGSFIEHFPLKKVTETLYCDTLIIPDIVENIKLLITAEFEDYLGNMGETISYPDTFTLSGPSLNPRVVSRYRMGSIANDDVIFEGSFCYLTDEYKLHYLNLSDPLNPRNHGTTYLPGWGNGMNYSDSLLFVSGGSGSQGWMHIYNITNPQYPYRVGRVTLTSKVNDVYIYKHYAFLANENHGVFFYDIEGLNIFPLLAQIELNFTGEALCLNEKTLYVTGESGVAIIDITLPGEPSLQSQISFLDFPEYAEVIGGLSCVFFNDQLFIACDASGVVRLDVTDPENPFFASIYPHLEDALGLEISYPNLIIARQDTLSFVNLTDFETLTVKEELGGFDRCREISVFENYLVVSEVGGILIIDQTFIE